MVEWNSWEKVMDNMVIDDIVEEMLTEETTASVYGADCTFGVCPCGVGVVWYRRMGMV